MQLAKKLKINNLMRQRMFIKMKLEGKAPEIYGADEKEIRAIISDGESVAADPCYPYVGYVYPENITFFQDEGFDVTKIEPKDCLSIGRGRPIFLFTPSNTIKLTQKEMKQSNEEILEGEFPETDEQYEKFIDRLLRIKYEDDDDEEDEE